MNFMDKNFLLKNRTSTWLYHEVAEGLPIIDYHCHLSPKEIADDRRFENITAAWLGGDHYKWRLMRLNGVDEKYITGDAPDYEKFAAWAATLPKAIGNPLYHWTHLELQRYFGVYKPLNPATARGIYDTCNEVLAQPDMSATGLITRSNVEVICTTDDPADTLEHHTAIKDAGKLSCKVLPTFRPDRAVDMERPDYMDYLAVLSAAAGVKIGSLSELMLALSARMDFFEKAGCRLSDESFEVLPLAEPDEAEAAAIFERCLNGMTPGAAELDAFKSYMITALGAMYAARGWTMQIHVGAMRNNNTAMFKRLGRDTGFDTMADHALARALSRLLDRLDSAGSLPKTILYTLNPKDNYVIAALCGAFSGAGIAGKVQFGSAWWFVDHKDGMEEQLRHTGNLAILGNFIGMLTDSRSFLSYTRHEYFRRIVCALIGGMVEDGEYPEDRESLESIIRGICHDNAAAYFGF